MRKIFAAVLVVLIFWQQPFYRFQKSESVVFDDTDLQREYLADNDEYFSGELPRDVSVNWANIPRDAEGEYIMGQEFQVGSTYGIAIDKKTNVTKSTAYMTLFHEECHIYNDVKQVKRLDAHGPAFQVCMFNLASEGAFKRFW